MKITFDPAKDEANIAKHDISLNDANLIRWDTLIGKIDNRKDYSEICFKASAMIGKRVYCIVYLDRGEERRIISLRKANRREAINYERQLSKK